MILLFYSTTARWSLDREQISSRYWNQECPEGILEIEQTTQLIQSISNTFSPGKAAQLRLVYHSSYGGRV